MLCNPSLLPNIFFFFAKKHATLPSLPPKKKFFFRWPHHFQNAGEGPAIKHYIWISVIKAYVKEQQKVVPVDDDTKVSNSCQNWVILTQWFRNGKIM